MKYLLMMMQNPANMNCEPIHMWPKKDIQAHIKFMMDLNRELKASGEFVSAEGLAGPEQAKIVRAGANGEPITTACSRNRKSSLPVSGYWMSRVLNGHMQLLPVRPRRLG